MGIAEKMSKRYEIYMNDNEERIVDDFCKEIKKERVSDLTLDEYSRFRFWKKEKDLPGVLEVPCLASGPKPRIRQGKVTSWEPSVQ